MCTTLLSFQSIMDTFSSDLTSNNFRFFFYNSIWGVNRYFKIRFSLKGLAALNCANDKTWKSYQKAWRVFSGFRPLAKDPLKPVTWEAACYPLTYLDPCISKTWEENHELNWCKLPEKIFMECLSKYVTLWSPIDN